MYSDRLHVSDFIGKTFELRQQREKTRTFYDRK